LLQLIAHPVGGVGVEAAYAGHLLAEALFGEDLGDAVLGHPCLVTVPEPMGVRPDLIGSHQASGVSYARDAVAAGWKVLGV
jgi:hypothetical protein